MDYSDLFKSGIGAVVGFALAQVVNIAKLAWEHWRAPKLLVENPQDNCLIPSHETEAGNGEFYREEIYGFDVRNVGRSIATGVRIQLIKIEIAKGFRPEFATISEHAYDLALYKGESHRPADTETVLVPEASVVVQLARWREDYDAVFPAVSGLPHYYEETCTNAAEYRFTVVAFDDRAQFSRRVLTIKDRSKGSKVNPAF